MPHNRKVLIAFYDERPYPPVAASILGNKRKSKEQAVLTQISILIFVMPDILYIQTVLSQKKIDPNKYIQFYYFTVSFKQLSKNNLQLQSLMHFNIKMFTCDAIVLMLQMIGPDTNHIVFIRSSAFFFCRKDGGKVSSLYGITSSIQYPLFKDNS